MHFPLRIYHSHPRPGTHGPYDVKTRAECESPSMAELVAIFIPFSFRFGIHLIQKCLSRACTFLPVLCFLLGNIEMGKNQFIALCTKCAMQHHRCHVDRFPAWWPTHNALCATRILLLQWHSSPARSSACPSLPPWAIDHSKEEVGWGVSLCSHGVISLWRWQGKASQAPGWTGAPLQKDPSSV